MSTCGKYIISGSADKLAKVWHNSLEHEYALVKPLFGHTRSVSSVVCMPGVVVTGGLDGVFKVWNCGGEWDCTHSVHAHRTVITAMLSVCDDKYLVTASTDCMMKVCVCAGDARVSNGLVVGIAAV